MAVELATAVVQLQPSAKGLLGGIQKELGDPLDSAGAAAGAKASASFADRFLSGTKAIGATAAVGIGAALGAGIGLEKIGSQFDEAFDHIRVGTGQTGAALEKLQGNFETVVTNVPTDFDSASQAITILNQRLGVTGEPLDKLAEQFLELSHITGVDLPTSVDSMTKVFNQWGISSKNQSKALDEVFRASQASGVGIDQLTQQVTQFGAPLRTLGFSFESSVSLLAQLGKAGVNADAVMAGLKKGVATLAKAGEPVPATFNRVVSEIQKLGPGTAATSEAIKLFGTRAGPELADAITSGRLNVQQLYQQITGGKDTILGAAKDTADWGEQLTVIKNRVLVALEPIASKVFGAIGDALKVATPFIGQFASGLVSLGGDVSSFLAPAFSRIGEIAKSAFSALASVDWAGVFKGAEKFVAPVVDAVGQLAAKVVQFAQAAWPRIESAFETILPIVERVGGFLRTGLDAAFNALSSTVGFLATHLHDVLIVLGPLAAALAAYKLVTLAIEGATKLWTAAQAALDAALDANPIGLIVIAVGALVGAVILAYNKVTWFRTAVDAVGRFFQDTLWPILQTVGHYVGVIFVGYVKALAFYYTDILWPALKLVAGFFTDVIIPAVAAVIGFFIDLGKAVIDAAGWVIARIGDVVSFIIGVPGKIGRILATLWDGLILGISAAKNWVIDRWNDIVAWVAAIPGRVGGFLSHMWDLLLISASAARNWVVNRFDDLVSFLEGIPSGIGKIFGGIADLVTAPFRAAFNAIAGLWNRTIGSLHFTIPSWVPLVGGKGFDVPNIPTFHDGGVVPGAPGQEVLIKAMAGETVLTTQQSALLAAPAGQPGPVSIGQLVVQSPHPPRRWLDEAGWRYSPLAAAGRTF